MPNLTLTVSKDSGGTRLDYLTITLENVIVTSYEIVTEPGADKPAEQVSFAFESITYRYIEDAGDGVAGDEHEIDYDIAAGV